MGKVIGIDLGTTNTAVAVMEGGRPRVLEDEKGYNVFPSCVSLSDKNEPIVGHPAKTLIMTRPDRTVYAIKRLMGCRFDSARVQQVKRRVGYDISEAPDGGCMITLGDQQVTPIDVSAMVLKHAKEMAEQTLGERVDEAVITVPAYFNHSQRQATFEAARRAGLHCDRLLNEPTAAALAFGFRRDYERTVLVYDLGGGTFDISILRMSSGVYETLSTHGDTYLGGEDFDFRLVDYLADDFQNRTGVDLRQDVVALQRLKDSAERAKCELSFTDRTTVLIPRVTAKRNLEMVVDRLTLEGLVEDLIERTLMVTRKAMTDSGLQISDIDDVILVGGQTRMPRVREAILGMFQKEPSRGVHPEEVVAVGAAVHAGSLGDESSNAPVLLDVTPFNLGIDMVGGLFRPIILRNTHIPNSSTQQFLTARNNQESVRIVIRQGEGKLAAENEFMGEFAMQGLTPGPNERSRVDVTFRLDSNGMLHVLATEPSTGERKEVTVRNYAQFAKKESNQDIQLDGDGSTSLGGTLPAESMSGRSHQTSSPSAPKKKGFGRFFGRKSKQEVPAVGAAVRPSAQPSTASPNISLPASSPPVLEREPIEETPEEPLPSSGPATLGMADSSFGMRATPEDLEPDALESLMPLEELQPLESEEDIFDLVDEGDDIFDIVEDPVDESFLRHSEEPPDRPAEEEREDADLPPLDDLDAIDFDIDFDDASPVEDLDLGELGDFDLNEDELGDVDFGDLSPSDPDVLAPVDEPLASALPPIDDDLEPPGLGTEATDSDSDEFDLGDIDFDVEEIDGPEDEGELLFEDIDLEVIDDATGFDDLGEVDDLADLDGFDLDEPEEVDELTVENLDSAGDLTDLEDLDGLDLEQNIEPIEEELPDVLAGLEDLDGIDLGSLGSDSVTSDGEDLDVDAVKSEDDVRDGIDLEDLDVFDLGSDAVTDADDLDDVDDLDGLDLDGLDLDGLDLGSDVVTDADDLDDVDDLDGLDLDGLDLDGLDLGSDVVTDADDHDDVDDLDGLDDLDLDGLDLGSDAVSAADDLDDVDDLDGLDLDGLDLGSDEDDLDDEQDLGTVDFDLDGLDLGEMDGDDLDVLDDVDLDGIDFDELGDLDDTELGGLNNPDVEAAPLVREVEDVQDLELTDLLGVPSEGLSSEMLLEAEDEPPGLDGLDSERLDLGEHGGLDLDGDLGDDRLGNLAVLSDLQETGDSDPRLLNTLNVEEDMRVGSGQSLTGLELDTDLSTREEFDLAQLEGLEVAELETISREEFHADELNELGLEDDVIPQDLKHLKLDEDLLEPAPPVPEPPAPKKKRKPAKLKLAYRSLKTMLDEQIGNIHNERCLVRTPSPLPLGRECRVEIQAPGLESPIHLNGVVSLIEDEGMIVSYLLSPERREELMVYLGELATPTS